MMQWKPISGEEKDSKCFISMEIVCGKLCYYGEDTCRGYTDINVQMASLLFTNIRLGN